MNPFKKIKNIHFLSLMGTGGMSVLNFLFAAILYRSLPTEETGVWFFFQTAFITLDMFRQGFLSTAFVKFYAGSSLLRKRQLIGSTWTILGLITLVAVLINLIVLIFIGYIDDVSLRYLLRYFPYIFVVSLPMLIAMCIAQAELKFDRLLYIEMLQTSILVVCLLVLIHFKQNNLKNVMYINIGAYAFCSVVCLLKGWTRLRYFGYRNKATILELYNFGKFTVGTAISSNIFNVTNASLINFLLGPAYLAIFNLGTRLMEVVEIPLRSFVATAMPILSGQYNQQLKDDVIRTAQKYIGFITLALIPVLIITLFFSNTIIGIIGGEQYRYSIEGAQAANIFRLYVFFALFYPADRFLAVTLDVIHRPQVNFRKIIIMFIINIVISAIGISIFKNIYVVVFANTLPVIVAIIISYIDINKHYQPFNLFTSYSLGFKETKQFLRKRLRG